MNKKLYTRLYRDNPGDFNHPIYVGGYYEKTGGLPAKRFRLMGIGMSAAVTALLVLIGSVVSVPGKAVYAALPYALSYLPAVMGLFAFLQAPADDGRIREDTWHNSMEKIQMYSAFGILFCGLSLIGGIAACVVKKAFGLPEILYVAVAAVNTAVFVLMRQLRKKQEYRLDT